MRQNFQFLPAYEESKALQYLHVRSTTWVVRSFSINFAVPFPQTAKGNKYLLVCVEHLTGRPIFVTTKRATAKTVVNFLKKKTILSFGPLGLLVSDDATCFTAGAMETISTRWKTMLAYVSLSNERTERIVGTTKQSVAQVFASSGLKWDAAVGRVVFDYCLQSNCKRFSPFEHPFGMKPKLIPTHAQEKQP